MPDVPIGFTGTRDAMPHVRRPEGDDPAMNASEDGLEPLGEAPDITPAATGQRARRRAGSIDDRRVEVINADETVLTVLVYPNGAVRFRSNQPRQWVAETLQRLADSLRERADREGA
ncbi:hypothetical protein TAJ_74 [Mycobacterium phage Taj]|uniref:Uncharacterized protein n=2 Tax=Cheoctovirus TaxID=1623281 RepID=E7EJU1_9CAUD|nr:hypothetical protein PBI_WEE_74 [Mycobacterium phage Wee]YP_009100186.1 hypothetical protein TAJ_74 [Mycobacterium phage Taj]ADU15945.1 hypothetical protein PBI_WEE_74 [Mycobacterium phage Wee]AFO10198.1 hypothetical protein TAJ_74 [Mycobacterium phage Taj]QGJ88237.1 hypothetical protein PBI_STANNES_68 [Mycobacterium phage StAnnes]